MGECPDWYPLLQAARYLRVAPWDLIDQNIFWRRIALDAQAAEAHARKQLENR